MSARTPAWSSQFERDKVSRLTPLRPLDDITPEWAWGNSRGAGVRVAVIDSGIDASHPTVGAVQGYVSFSEDGDQITHSDEPHNDSYGHGTACAGIIRSIAPDCELYSVKVLGPMLFGRGTIFAAGLRWAIENGMHVCNLSLGTTRREFYAVLHELADEAYFRNIALVTAANNLPTPSFPSIYASVISVAAHDIADSEVLYYNPQPPVEFGAHGIDVRVPWLDGGWITMTGNSFAAPNVTGRVARILGRHAGLTVFQVKSILRSLSSNMTRDSG